MNLGIYGYIVSAAIPSQVSAKAFRAWHESCAQAALRRQQTQRAIRCWQHVAHATTFAAWRLACDEQVVRSGHSLPAHGPCKA